MEGAICYRPEAGFAWCAVSWYPAVAKGVGTRAEATDAMDLQCSNVVTLPDGYGEITVPTMSFNVIYILSHHLYGGYRFEAASGLLLCFSEE